MKKTKVFITIPNSGHLCNSLITKLPELMNDKRYDVIFQDLKISQRKPSAHNRNLSVQEFLKTDCEYFITIDETVVPRKNPLDYIASDKDVVGALCVITKESKLLWSALDTDNEGKNNPLDIDAMLKSGWEGFAEVDIIGSGCMVIARRVLEKIPAPFERLWENGLSKMGLDFYFCNKVKSAGFKVWIQSQFTASLFKELDLFWVNKLLQDG